MSESDLKTTEPVTKLPANPAASAPAVQSDNRLPIGSMDPQLTTIQPGGGIVMRLELAWGRLRRRYLKTFRPGYVARMRELRQGDSNPCAHEVLDPRDLKFYRNQGGWFWQENDDPFTWRDRLPFVRVGLAELLVCSLLTFGPAAALVLLTQTSFLSGVVVDLCLFVAVALAVIGGLIAWFFRNPRRSVPQGEGLVVAPADGKVVSIEEIETDEYIGGPAVRIGIFLSILNVHVNRIPVSGRVIGLQYRPGKCLNALRPESARENERLTVRIEENAPPYRRMIVSQITGAIARRIVCWLKPGDELPAGEPFGMIKLGSRTELVLPRQEGLQITTKVGDHVKAGATVLAEYRP